MLYYIYITRNGSPQDTLSPNWETLITAENGTDKSGSAPAITEIGGAGNGGGWYKFSVILGTAPWDVITQDLVGVVDADPTNALGMAASERYIPMTISLRGLALAKIAHKAIETKSTGDIEYYASDGSTGAFAIDMTNGEILCFPPLL